ncbi:hypothetical protein N7494_012833 [Penicillium frequentans]|uniref:Zn(2)-C6 fungal-type domain-containing protein n=1 Tax=Penicillium frequentans TaxID=3151616 RepID=A0AAD6CMB0_9EURO|nr:hypothetical protein N7494_012833 [Penicillium glabrum]
MHRIQKASANDSNSGAIHAQSSKIGARSCLGCHQRKVRCDRGVPCKNCSRYSISCIYPRRESEGKAATVQRISDRLERLENIISQAKVSGPSNAAEAQDDGNQKKSGPTQSSHEPWELLLNDGQAIQYVNNSNIKDLLQDEERIRATQTPNLGQGPLRKEAASSAYTTPCQECPLPDTASDILEFYPGPELALPLWQIYVNSVDPVLKILHIPTAQSAVIATILNPKSAGRSMVALTYAIYFAAITALEDGSEEITLPLEKKDLLKRYRLPLERLLIDTDVMNSPEMTSLQALAIFVTCLRVNETGRSIWILVGLAIRLAQSIGLHRDGARLRLSPFETEMRLRLWWYLCSLDSRSPEDHGFEPVVDVVNAHLRLPLNINDDQLYLSMTELPAESDGWTEMSFFLVQTQACRLMHPVIGTRRHSSTDTLADIAEKRKFLTERGQALREKYGFQSETPSELCRIAFQHCNTARYKMNFILQLREEVVTQRQDGFQRDEDSAHRLSFKIACDELKSHRTCTKGSLASRFKWLFPTFTQWYALAYVLRCLCTSSNIPDADYVWGLIEDTFPQYMRNNDQSVTAPDANKQSTIWKCLSRLRHQALLLRNSQSSVGGRIVQSVGLETGQMESQTIPSRQNIFNRNGDPISESDQNAVSSLDFLSSDPQFLSDWNAVMNSCLIDEDDMNMM